MNVANKDQINFSFFKVHFQIPKFNKEYLILLCNAPLYNLLLDRISLYILKIVISFSET